LPLILAVAAEGRAFHVSVVERIRKMHHAMGVEAMNQSPGMSEFVDSLSQNALAEER
jgi:hypothetical protein